MRRLLLIANPSARGFTGAALREVTSTLSQHFDVDQEWPETPTGSRLAAAKAAAASYDVVAAMGGDGVAHHVANGLVDTETALAVLPSGTTNVLGRVLGLKPKPTKVAAMLHRCRPRPIRVVQVTADDNDPFFATFAVGLGYDAAVLARSERQPHSKTTWGPLHYARSAIEEMRGHNVPTIRARAHRRNADGAALSVQVQHTYTFLGRLPFRFGGTPTTGFNVLVVHKIGARTVGTVGGLATGRLEKDRSDATVWTDVASMEAHAEPSAPLQADGEPYGTVAQVTVEAGNHRLMVVGP